MEDDIPVFEEMMKAGRNKVLVIELTELVSPLLSLPPQSSGASKHTFLTHICAVWIKVQEKIW